MMRYNIVEVSDSQDECICTLAYDGALSREQIETNVTDLFADGFFGSDDIISDESRCKIELEQTVTSTSETQESTHFEIKCRVMLIEEDVDVSHTHSDFLTLRIDSDSIMYYKNCLGNRTARVINEYDFSTTSVNLGIEFNQCNS